MTTGCWLVAADDWLVTLVTFDYSPLTTDHCHHHRHRHHDHHRDDDHDDYYYCFAVRWEINKHLSQTKTTAITTTGTSSPTRRNTTTEMSVTIATQHQQKNIDAPAKLAWIRVNPREFPWIFINLSPKIVPGNKFSYTEIIIETTYPNDRLNINSRSYTLRIDQKHNKNDVIHQLNATSTNKKKRIDAAAKLAWIRVNPREFPWIFINLSPKIVPGNKFSYTEIIIETTYPNDRLNISSRSYTLRIDMLDKRTGENTCFYIVNLNFHNEASQKSWLHGSHGIWNKALVPWWLLAGAVSVKNTM